MRSFLLLHCRPEELPHIARDKRRLEYFKAQITPDVKTEAESVLTLLDADLVTT
jgi:hypothetical protein